MDRSDIICTVFFVVIITFSVGNGIVYHGEPESTVARNNGHQMAPADLYTPHAPITISSDADFSTQGWPGNGSLANPYVIAGLNITADAVCINIVGTTVYFEVRDCLISSENESSYDGIILYSVANGVVRDCNIDKHNRGVYLFYSPDCILTNNTVFNNSNEGFYIHNSPNCILTNNSAFSKVSGQEYGFYVDSSNGCILTNNSASTYSRGFYLLFSYYCTMTNNSASLNLYGIYLFVSWSCTLTSNTVTGLSYMAGYGIYVNGCDNVTLTDNAAYNSHYGIIHDSSHNGILVRNTASDNDNGFYIRKSDNTTLMNNKGYSNHYQGFILGSSNSCIITGNTAYNNSMNGFAIGGENNTLTNNIAFSNLENGFYLIAISNITLTSNSAYDNSLDGFSLEYTNNSILTNNIATNNTEVGVRLGAGCENNTLYLNWLGDNGVANAQDNGSENFWDDGVSLGNYWLDYNGTGTYPIPGSAGSVDHYPFGWVAVPSTNTTSSETGDIVLVIVLSGAGIAVVVIVVIVFLKKRGV